MKNPFRLLYDWLCPMVEEPTVTERPSAAVSSDLTSEQFLAIPGQRVMRQFDMKQVYHVLTNVAAAERGLPPGPYRCAVQMIMLDGEPVSIRIEVIIPQPESEAAE